MGQYHDILGISDKATDSEITDAFRKLAKKYHPDVNQGDPEAEAKFKEINEAASGLKNGMSGPAPSGGNNMGFNWGTRDPFADLKASFNNFGRHANANQQTFIHETIGIPLELFMNGGIHKFSIRMGNITTNKDIVLEPDTAVGTAIMVDLPEAPNVKFNLTLVPVSDTIDIHGINLVISTDITALEAMVGFAKRITLPDNKEIEVNIPSGTQPSSLLRVFGKGLRNTRNDRGNVFIKVDVTIPKLSDEQKEKIKEIMEQTGII